MSKPAEGLLNTFFGKHEPQRSYQFLVEFPELVDIPSYMVKSVSIPNFMFKKELHKVGGVFSRSFPVLDNDGLDLKLEIEEDNKGSVSKFIVGLQQRIIDQKGYYNFPEKSRVGTIDIHVLDWSGEKVVTYKAKNCFFLKAEDIKYSYNEQYIINYMITFGFDYYQYEYFK